MSDILLVEYNPAWPQRFEEERGRILAAAGEYIEAIEHVGSTSIPGLVAKPIIDILAIVRDLSLVEHCVEPLARLGYGYLGECGIAGRHYFRRPNTDNWLERIAQIHMCTPEGREGRRQRLFRNYLRAHPEVAQEYARLKQANLERLGSHPDAHTLYPDAKTEFVESVLAKARTEGFEI
jgi:GrpB-like predicted nucleotidyltransferase (UPF0157 family)